MALNSLYCADVPLSNYSLTHPEAHFTVSLFVGGTRKTGYFWKWFAPCLFWLASEKL